MGGFALPEGPSRPSCPGQDADPEHDHAGPEDEAQKAGNRAELTAERDQRAGGSGRQPEEAVHGDATGVIEEMQSHREARTVPAGRGAEHGDQGTTHPNAVPEAADEARQSERAERNAGGVHADRLNRL